MAANLASIVYTGVIEDVITNVRAEFLNDNVDEAVLGELQSLWQLKMIQSGITLVNSETSYGKGGTAPAGPVHDLNVPYEPTDEYESATPTVEILFPPTPLTNTADPVMYQYFPAGPSESTPIGEMGHSGDVAIGRPAPYMQQPASWMNQRPLGVDVNIAYEEAHEDEENGQPPVTKDFFTLSAGKRKREDFPPNYFPTNYIPQQDGAVDIDHSLMPQGKNSWISGIKEDQLKWDTEKMLGRSKNICEQHLERIEADKALTKAASSIYTSSSICIQQLDGVDDEYDDGVEEDYNEAPDEDAAVDDDSEFKSHKVEGNESDESEPPLNEEDDEPDDLDDGDEEQKTDHLVVAQFEKVSRTKNKWKCILKDGVMHLNQRDHLFSKANGEFDF